MGGIMLKNIRIRARMIVIGMLIVAIPLAVVAYIAVDRARAGLSALSDEQLRQRSRQLAGLIDKVYQEEGKLALTLAADPDVVAAAVSVKERGVAASAEALAKVTAKLAMFASNAGLHAAYETANLMSWDGIVVAASDATAVGRVVKERDYFMRANSGQAHTGTAIVSKVTGKPITPVVTPVTSNMMVVGVVALMMNIDFLAELIAGEKVGDSGYVFISDASGMTIAHPVKENVLKLNIGTLAGMETLARRMTGGESGVLTYSYKGVLKAAGFAPVKSTGWSVAMVIPVSEYMVAVNQVRNIILLVSFAAVIMAFLVYVLFSQSITKPLARGVAFAQVVAAGDFTQHLDIHQKDEIGKLADALNAMSDKLHETVAAIQESAEQVAASSEEISASAQSLAEGTQSQASTLEETSASVEELTASVGQVAQHAQGQAAAVEQGAVTMARTQKSFEEMSRNLVDISSLAHASVEKSTEGFQAVATVMEAIELIAEGSGKITGIVNVISDIADQTNLLALNAAIEAARAGEHGRGFAVVADEVSKLADRSSSSTKEIEGLIKESVSNVTRGVDIARRSQSSMDQIKSASQQMEGTIGSLSQLMGSQVAAVKELAQALESVTEMSRSISAATGEQTTNARQVSTAVENVNELTQAAASAAEQMSASTEHLSGMAQQLQTLMGQFTIEGRGRVALERTA
jgi:methyl-accepting chemotaxis protein